MFYVWQVYQNKVKIKSHLKKGRAKTKKTHFDICKPLAFFCSSKDENTKSSRWTMLVEVGVVELCWRLKFTIWVPTFDEQKKALRKPIFPFEVPRQGLSRTARSGGFLSLLPTTWKRFEPDRIGLQCGRQVWPLLRREHYVLVVASRRQMLKSCEFQTLWCSLFAEVGL